MDLKSYAKINLYLNVINRRKDNYHNLDMIMCSIDLYDTLSFELIDEGCIITSNNTDVPLDDSNLCVKAYNLMKEKYNINKGLKIHIEKRIPIGGGLAGGSSNCATTLHAISGIFNLELSTQELMYIAKDLGSDVPFCLHKLPARVQGVGDIVFPIHIDTKFEVILYTHELSCHTGKVFNSLDITDDDKSPDELITALSSSSSINEYLYNELENATFSVYPEMNVIHSKLKDIYKEGVLMSGSGSSFFVITDKEPVSIEGLEYKRCNVIL